MRKTNWQVVLLFCVFILLTANVLITMNLFLKMQQTQRKSEHRESLPCKAVPVRFVIEEPDCANKLLRSMNVTNVHILPDGALSSLLNRKTLRLQNLFEGNGK